jgi:hypothetical protein
VSRPLLLALAAALTVLFAAGARAEECSARAVGGPVRCLYRSLLPSAGLVAVCATDSDCRVGHYYGDPERAVWLAPPAGIATLPRPEVIWRTATLAEARFDCGRACSFSYFFEARRRRLSAPRWAVLAVDARRWLLAAAEGRALVVRQLFAGREVIRLERDWAPAAWLGEVLRDVRFDPDGRLTLTWLRGADRVAVTERVSVPSGPRSSGDPRLDTRAAPRLRSARARPARPAPHRRPPECREEGAPTARATARTGHARPESKRTGSA